jgi:hypothetical protein
VRLDRFGRPAAVGITIVLLVIVGTYETWILLDPHMTDLGGDLDFFRGIASRWLETGELYTPHQLSGPYDAQLQVDNLYPPHALLLFVPFTVLPGILWWALPLGTTAYVIARIQPAWWSWPLLAALVVWPKTIVGLLWGNTDMWVVAGIAGGIRWGWPAALVTIKPIFGPFAIVGVRRRSFWIAVGALTLLGVVMQSLWLDYVAVVRNVFIPIEYPLRSIPTMFIPIVAWFARRRDPVMVRTAARSQTDVATGNIPVVDGRP